MENYIDEKPKKTLLKRKWFIILMILIALFVIFIIIGLLTPDTENYVWFDEKGGSKVNDITLPKDQQSKIDKPDDPTKEGFTFDGWYKDSDCTDEWDFDEDIVDKDITLYAKWIEIVVPISGIGDTLEVGDVSYKLISVTDAKSFGDVFVQSTENNFVIITLDITNLKTSEFIIYNSDFTLKKDTLSYEVFNGSYDLENGILINESLNPGIKKTIQIAFETPKTHTEEDYILRIKPGLLLSVDFELK